jgi:hypothetical protein
LRISSQKQRLLRHKPKYEPPEFSSERNGAIVKLAATRPSASNSTRQGNTGQFIVAAMASPPPVEDQSRLLEDALAVVRQQTMLMRRCLETPGKLMDALKCR